uniref:Putative lipocal-1 1 n=1 Tax=Ixodes ricinus TaxID=34613 RepID=V5H6E0_IXORI
MIFALFAVAALLVHHSTYATTPYPEQNPAFQEYQNQSPYFPLEETWYMAYRNYETDPFFGGTAKCVRVRETDPGQNGAYPVIVEYDPSFSSNITVTLSLSPEYTLKNVLNFHPQGQDISVPAYTVYKDVKKCDILRLTYAGDGACAILVPKSQLGNHAVCCDFIFDLLCGTHEKYMVYDPSCP